MQEVIIVLHAASQAKLDNTKYNKQLSLSSSNTRISIDTSVPNDKSFITFTKLDGCEIFSISDLKCVIKLMKVLRDVLPIGAFIEENHLNIASAFIECVKTCTEMNRNAFATIKSETFVTEEILKKNPLLERHKVQNLLRINKTDFSCIANLYKCVSILNSCLNASIRLEKDKGPRISSNHEIPTASNLGIENNKNVVEISNTLTNSSDVQQNQVTLPIIAVPQTYHLLLKTVGRTPPENLMDDQ